MAGPGSDSPPLSRRLSRRRSLAALGAAGAALALAGCAQDTAAPGAAAPQKTFEWKMQSTWAAGDFTNTFPQYLCDRIEKMSAGRLKIQMEPAGTYVPAFEVLDATHKGVLDACHSWAGYWVGKHPAAALFCGIPAFGMDQFDGITWLYMAGGLDLYNEMLQKELAYNVVAFVTLAEVPEPLGWFKKPITSWEDLKGLKFRAGGVAAEIFQKAGMSVVSIPGGDIVPSGEKGVLDAAEWSDPTADMSMGFHDVWKYYHMPGMHQPVAFPEFLVNKGRWEELPDDLKEIVESGCRDTSFTTWMQLWYRNHLDLEVLKTKYGVTVVETPKDILIKVLEGADEVIADKAAANAFAARVRDSQRDFASKFVPYRRMARPPYELAADYYWKR